MKLIARKAGASTDTSRDHVYTDWLALDRTIDELFPGALWPCENQRQSQHGHSQVWPIRSRLTAIEVACRVADSQPGNPLVHSEDARR